MLVSILIISSLGATTFAASRKIVRPLYRVFEDTGVVQKVEYKYLINGDRGVMFMGRLWRSYDPLNLPEKFRVDGMSVKFEAKIAIYRLRGLTNFLIYKYLPIEIMEINSLERIKGFVTDEVTHKPIIGAKIVLESRAPPSDWKVLDECISDGKGQYEFKSVDFDLKMSYRIRTFKEGYRTFEYSLPPVPSGKTRFLNISLINIKEKFSIDYPKDGDTISGKIVIRGRIYDSEIKAIWVSIDKGEWRKAEIYWLGLPDPSSNAIAIWQYEWDTREVTDGKHVISVRTWYGGSYIYKHVTIIVKNDLSVICGQVTEAPIIPIIQANSNESSLEIAGKPIEGAEVAAYPLQPDDSRSIYPPLYVTYTDENGTYELKLPSGGYMVEVTKEGYEKSSKSVYIKPGEIKKLDLTLHKIWIKSKMYGRVIEAPIIGIDDKNSPQYNNTKLLLPYKPIPNARVVAYPKKPVPLDNVSLDRFYETFTDENGYYEMELPPGCYVVKVTKKGYHPVIRDVCLAYGEQKKVDLALMREYSTATIYGKVTEYHSWELPWIKSKPIPNATVIAYLKYPPIDISVPVSYTTKTDSQGRYVLKVFSPGEYVVRVFKEGYKSARKEIKLRPYEYKRLDFKLERIFQRAKIYGKVTEAPLSGGNEPIPEALVKAVRIPEEVKTKSKDEISIEDMVAVYTTYTDEEGRYQLFVDPGHYRIEVMREGYAKKVFGYLWLRPGDSRRLDIVTYRPALLHGQILEHHSLTIDNNETAVDLRPIAGAKVALYTPLPIPIVRSAAGAPVHNERLAYVTYTNENGTYTIENIAPGRYILKVSKSGYERKEERIFLYSGDNVEKTFILDKIKENIIYVDESYNGKDMYLNMNQYLNLTLVQNPSTGYRWDFVDFNNSIMEIVDHFYWGYPQHDPPILGAPCNETWILKPLKSCDFELKLKYWQSWEPNSTLKTFNLTIHIIDIHLDLIFPQGERHPQNASMPIIINLENRGNVTALVSYPGLETSSLYIYITTPTGREIRYIGPHVLTLPGTIILPPGGGYTKNLTISSADFGFDDGTHYYFDEIGKHDIRVVYRSWRVGDNRWIGSIEADGYSFYIESDMPS
ncbi:MAG TPA: PEGA domain-containing protein [Thermoplasmatales archaeon]|nr:PEGA domain-containing protein [Thermoplasmatales archaeon]